MIESLGTRVAYLGGNLGDELYVSEEAGPFRLLARLGTNRETQITPQRRMCLTDEDVLVLEPCEGPMLDPPFRVRRFDFQGGREPTTTEGAGRSSPDGDLYWRADREGADRMQIVRYGVDRETGEALTHTVVIPRPPFLKLRWARSGIPLVLKDGVWLAFRHEGLVRLRGESSERFAGDPARPVEVDGHCVAPGHESVNSEAATPGVFVDGVFRELGAGEPLFPPWHIPLGPMVLEGPTVLACDGRIFGPTAVPPLPPGRYIGILRLGGVVCALEQSEAPKWVTIPDFS